MEFIVKTFKYDCGVKTDKIMTKKQSHVLLQNMDLTGQKAKN